MTIRAEERGAADRLLDLVLNSSAHLWHNRPGVDVNGVWHPATTAPPGVRPARRPARPLRAGRGRPLLAAPRDLPAQRRADGALRELRAHRDRLARPQGRCAALMLVQPRAGEPVHDDDGSVAFHDDDYRDVGEAMILRYEKKSTRMMTPKAVLRVAAPAGDAGDRRAQPRRGLRRSRPAEAAARPLDSGRPRSGSPTARRTCRCSRAW